jgi:hypothetical protein
MVEVRAVHWSVTRQIGNFTILSFFSFIAGQDASSGGAAYCEGRGCPSIQLKGCMAAIEPTVGTTVDMWLQMRNSPGA